mmetsp:Transcript_5356/g.10247  ORF Transcript_5356/g.10247 Transcript_5356/m.10247 type:complete len:106 (+) Transcript_5356:1061-1378(+)
MRVITPSRPDQPLSYTVLLLDPNLELMDSFNPRDTLRLSDFFSAVCLTIHGCSMAATAAGRTFGSTVRREDIKSFADDETFPHSFAGKSKFPDLTCRMILAVESP